MSTELERVREKLYERASITLTDVFERLVREEQDKISREDERAKLIRAHYKPDNSIKGGF